MPNYWKISPGPNASGWTIWKEKGIATIGWSRLEDLTNIDRAEFDSRAQNLSQRFEDYMLSANTSLTLFSAMTSLTLNLFQRSL